MSTYGNLGSRPSVPFELRSADLPRASSGNGWAEQNHFSRVTLCNVGLSEISKLPPHNPYAYSPPLVVICTSVISLSLQMTSITVLQYSLED
jgi:hypothetical protein